MHDYKCVIGLYVPVRDLLPTLLTEKNPIRVRQMMLSRPLQKIFHGQRIFTIHRLVSMRSPIPLLCLMVLFQIKHNIL